MKTFSRQNWAILVVIFLYFLLLKVKIFVSAISLPYFCEQINNTNLYHMINPDIEVNRLVRTLTIITTYKCSASCSNCCFACSPQRSEFISFENAAINIDNAINSFHNIRTLALTGGESLLNLDFVCLLLSSCTCGNINVVDEFISPDSRTGNDGSAIHIEMDDKQVEYLKKLASLSQRIIEDRNFAKEFVRSSRKYIPNSANSVQSNGVDDDETLMKILNALADDEIAEAVKANDIKKYLLLMNEKGLLEDNAKINDYGNLMTADEKKALLKSIGFTQIPDVDLEPAAVAAVVFVFYAAVVAVSWVGVAYTVAATINMAAAVSVVAYSAAAVKTKVTTSSCVENVQLSSNFDVYILSASDENMKILFSDENINKTVCAAVEAYSQIFVEDAKKMDMEKFRQTINLNLSKQPEISNGTIIIDNKKGYGI